MNGNLYRNRVLKSSLSQKKKDMLLISKDEYDESEIQDL